ncbi:MAG: ABC transporter substrate-binding protein [Chloroflexi bacterium]|nr:ABC transporter substrate-binding protein [Chloroflexota bacterium]
MPTVTRRSLLLALTALPLAAACSPAAQSTAPTSAPATAAPKPTDAAPKPAATTAPVVVASPAAAPAAPTAAASPAAAAAPKPSGATVTLPKPEKTSIKMGFSALEAIMAGYFLAEANGLFKKYGIDQIELLFNDGDAKTMQSLISGGTDATAQGSSVAISSLLTDAPIVMVAMSTDKITDDFTSIASVKTAADLKGKKVAISNFGSTSHASVLLALRGLGLTANDVTITGVGGEAARLAALQSGTVAAAPVEIFRRPELKQRGYNVLISVAESPGLEFPRNGLNFVKEFADKNPNTVLAMTAAALEGMQLLYTDAGKQKAIDLFAQRAQLTDRTEAAARVDSLQPYLRRDMSWTKGAFDFAKELLVTQTPALKDVDASKAYSYQYLDKLAELGFQDAVGAPRPRKG